MTCYMRHMDWLFDELALPSDKKNRARIDRAVRSVMSIDAEAGCPEAWKAIKSLSDDERYTLAHQVAEVLDAS